MNKQLFRIVFNKTRGLLMAVAENVTASGKQAGAGNAPGRARSLTLRLKGLRFSVLLALGMVGTVAHAQVVADPNAPGSQQPTILDAGNGVPLVNIQTPSAAGVSRNTYKQFDVNQQGVILNNSRSNTQTQLGGYVQGNPWLAGGAARVILNEVNSANPSYLRGYVEVAGQRAEVIIANPSGIQVNGGGFLNASSVTLTTGKPTFVSGGALEGFRIADGVIGIDGAGLDASRADYTSLLARAVEVNAGLWAQQLKVVTGANEVSADQSQVKRIAASGAAPQFLLDVGALGGMYANKIYLVGTEQGVGMRNAGLIGAMAGDLVVTVDGRLENRGMMDGSQTRIEAETIENIGSGRIYGDHVALQAGTLINREETVDGRTQAATIASRGDMDIGAGTLTNREQALIFSAGDMRIGGALDKNGQATGSATTVHNASATIESLGDMAISTQSLLNSNEHFDTEEVMVDGPRPLSYIQPKGDPNKYDISMFVWKNWSRAGRYEWKDNPPPDTGVLGSSPIPHVGEQNCTGEIDGPDEVCWRVPGADYLADNPTWAYFGLTPPDPEPLAPQEAAFDTPEAYAAALEQWGIDRQTWVDATEARYEQLDARIETYNDQFDDREIRKWTQYQVTRTEFETQVKESAPALIRAGGDLQLTGQEFINDKSQILVGGALRGDIGNLQNLDAFGEYRIHEVGTSQYTTSKWHGGLKRYYTREWDSKVAYAPADEVTAFSLNIAAVQENAPGGGTNTKLPNSSLFNINPDGSYLIETDPRFADYRKWMSSDYLFEQMNIDPATTQKRLGDGFYEQKLIRDQVAQLTGRRFLDGYANDEAQYRALMEAGATFALEYDLIPGVALSAAQMAALTSDIVWLVAEEVILPDGSKTTALVPKVYVLAQPGDLKGNGTLISANAIDLNLMGDLTNSGTLAGRQVVQLSGENLNNLGGRITGAAVQMQADNDINNIGGTIDAQNALLLSAGHDINVASTTHSETNQVGKSSFSGTNLNRLAGLYITNPDGAGILTAQASNDINLQAAQIVNAGQNGLTALAAGHDINLTTVTVGRQDNSVRNAKNYLTQGSTQEIGSTILANSDIVLSSGNDITMRAADIGSGGAVIAQAAGDINIQAGEASANWSEGHERKSSGFMSSSTSTTRDSLTQTVAQASTISGNTVSVQGNNITVTGSNVLSEAGTTLAAQNDLTVQSAQNTWSEEHFKEEKRSGLTGGYSAGVLSVGYGSASGAGQSTQSGTQQVGSAIVSQGGDVTLTAGNKATIAASDVGAGQNLTIAAKEI
ncbi:MAG: filamentous hemagglutinin N-terminal domain-containing protein, partial [Azonexus sp.]|uniref:two-partner secretion domain-containing protein n=1 Tax=Azonexus sp. TaxID=1872668 RepID=UPI0028326F22